MTRSILLSGAAFVLALGAAPASLDAQIRGEVRIENPRVEIDGEEFVAWFGALRAGEHRIHFIYDGPPAAFTLVTTVLRDGRQVGRTERHPLPYFPGDMWMCPEAWDFVSLLPFDRSPGETFGHLRPGDYEIRLEAVPTDPRMREGARMEAGVIRLRVR